MSSRFADRLVRLDEVPLDLRAAKAGDVLSLSDGTAKELAEDCGEARSVWGEGLGYVRAVFTKPLPTGRTALDFTFAGKPHVEPPGTPSVLAIVRAAPGPAGL